MISLLHPTPREGPPPRDTELSISLELVTAGSQGPMERAEDHIPGTESQMSLSLLS